VGAVIARMSHTSCLLSSNIGALKGQWQMRSKLKLFELRVSRYNAWATPGA